MTVAAPITGYRWAKIQKTRQLKDELAESPKPKPNKFNAKKTELDGIVFDSAKESRRYAELRVLERAGQIIDLRLQEKFTLTVNGIKIASYKADFVYVDYHGKTVVEDVKSPPTAKKSDFRMKVKLMRACHGIDVVVLL